MLKGVGLPPTMNDEYDEEIKKIPPKKKEKEMVKSI